MTVNSISVVTARSDSSVVTRRHKHCSQEPAFNASKLYVAKDSTGHSGNCGVPRGATTDLHVMSLSNYKLRTNCLTLFNGVKAFLSVAKRHFSSVCVEF